MWPSRVKVFIQSFMTAALGVAIFSYMTSADLGYLDLTTPKYEEPLCLTKWPLRHETASWISKDLWVDWMNYRTDMLAWVAQNSCNASAYIGGETCSVIDIPLHDMQRKLGTPLGRSVEYQYTNDILEVYALLFLYLTICLWVAVVIHDMTLLSRRNHRAALDLRGVDRQFPCFRACFCCVMGYRSWGNARAKAVAQGKGALKVLLMCALPFVILWSVVVFFGMVVPACLILFIRYPIRLGRLQIFVLCICITTLCLTMSVRLFVQLGSEVHRPRYAITWQAGACTCGCVYAMKTGGILQILTMAVTIGYKAAMLALRCLKGLRRANWANLMTVMFAIPLTVYPSEWFQPDGKPIKFRQEGDPVQGEPAFDPFAMMDEQPNSSSTTCDLRPTPVRDNTAKSGKTVDPTGTKFSAPRIPTQHLDEATIYQEEIGCCGFPYLTKVVDRDEENPEDELPRPEEQPPEQGGDRDAPSSL